MRWRAPEIFAKVSGVASDEPRLTEISDLSLQCGLLLMQHGAESALVENVSRRIGLALGAERVDVAIMANALTISASRAGETDTRVARNEDQGINMRLLMDVQQIMLAAEMHEIDWRQAKERVRSLTRVHYPRWLVALAIGLSCAAFARLAD